MAGRIQFDREEALQAALMMFWEKGFAATSMDDLKTATGIKESSLYNTFGNKKKLFRETLDAYWEQVQKNMAALPFEEHPAEAIRILMRSIAQRASQPGQSAGCMMMNSALELGEEHQDIIDVVRARYAQMEKIIHDAVVLAQSQNEISTNKDPVRLARYLNYSLQSMFTIARTHPTEAYMTDIVETTLSVLD